MNRIEHLVHQEKVNYAARYRLFSQREKLNRDFGRPGYGRVVGEHAVVGDGYHLITITPFMRELRDWLTFLLEEVDE